MRLYLSSYRIPNIKKFSKFVGKKPADIKFGLILNAKDYKPKNERKEKLKELLEYFSGFGFDVEEVNLFDYKDEKKLLERFKEFDVLWFNGGNTFYLRWAIKESRTEKVLKKALESGVVYGGDSAGAIIVGPTLKYCDMADDPKVSPEIIYDGLNYLDVAILPHWGSEKYDYVLKDTETKLKKDGFKTTRLSDGEYLLVENGKILSARGPSK